MKWDHVASSHWSLVFGLSCSTWFDGCLLRLFNQTITMKWGTGSQLIGVTWPFGFASERNLGTWGIFGVSLRVRWCGMRVRCTAANIQYTKWCLTDDLEHNHTQLQYWGLGRVPRDPHLSYKHNGLHFVLPSKPYPSSHLASPSDGLRLPLKSPTIQR